MRLALPLVVGFLFFPLAARAACTLPPGVEGQILYNQDYKLVQYCEATNWVKLGGSTTDSRIGTLTANKWCAANSGGTGFDCTQNAPTATVSGTPNYVAKFTSATAVGNSLIYDNGTNVGIGTTAPSTALQVQSASPDAQLMLSSSAPSIKLANDPVLGNSTMLGILAMATANSNYGLSAGDVLLGAYGSARGNLYINANYSGVGTKNVILQPNTGNVGIGTSSPGDKFTVHFGADSNVGLTSSTYPVLASHNDAWNSWGNLQINSNMFLLAGGNVGIGTTSPTERFEVNTVATASDVYLRLNMVGGSVYKNGIKLRVASDNYGFDIIHDDTASLGYRGLNIIAHENSAAGVSAMFIRRDNGNVGLGTTSPGARFEIKAGSATYGGGLRLTASANSNTWEFVNSGGDLYLGYNSGGGNPEHIFKSNGNVGIGTTSPQAGLHVDGPGGDNRIRVSAGSNAVQTELFSNTGYAGGVGSVGTRNNYPFMIRTNDTERIFISTSGAIRFVAYGGGTLITDASGNITLSSDERLKNIQGRYTRGLEAITQINPILYKWNAKSGNEVHSTYAGMSAQNVQSAIPEAVGTDKRGYLTLSDRPIEAALINAVKELKVENDNQDEEIHALRDELKALKASVR